MWELAEGADEALQMVAARHVDLCVCVWGGGSGACAAGGGDLPVAGVRRVRTSTPRRASSCSSAMTRATPDMKPDRTE